ncbi:unnamed protein product, partial [Larinioides sclopetarius]
MDYWKNETRGWMPVRHEKCPTLVQFLLAVVIMTQKINEYTLFVSKLVPMATIY